MVARRSGSVPGRVLLSMAGRGLSPEMVGRGLSPVGCYQWQVGVCPRMDAINGRSGSVPGWMGSVPGWMGSVPGWMGSVPGWMMVGQSGAVPDRVLLSMQRSVGVCPRLVAINGRLGSVPGWTGSVPGWLLSMAVNGWMGSVPGRVLSMAVNGWMGSVPGWVLLSMGGGVDALRDAGLFVSLEGGRPLAAGSCSMPRLILSPPRWDS
ncbi:hypothetical protein Enr13x_08750 [Stieleria neptunia]|uniref:Uncharacterized protein n=1 Tax=Stieleria neptunia TaxID=2527979 RepID=A0A518HJL0_9BACT|nr:hypothetical protein Enr13x_08750 [Stieleria neptunia]